jgi:hypothetical protein
LLGVAVMGLAAPVSRCLGERVPGFGAMWAGVKGRNFTGRGADFSRRLFSKALVSGPEGITRKLNFARYRGPGSRIGA